MGKEEQKRKYSSSWSAICDAVRNGDVVEVKRLIDSEPQLINATNELGWTLLHLVAAQGIDTVRAHEEIARFLIGKGADVNAKAAADITPLHLIAANGSKESLPVATVLLENHANPYSKDKIGWLPRMYWQHGVEIRDLLMKYMNEKKDL